jgi:hypothetical protein
VIKGTLDTHISLAIITDTSVTSGLFSQVQTNVPRNTRIDIGHWLKRISSLTVVKHPMDR